MTADNSLITLTLNGQTVEASTGQTILQVAGRHGIDIPHICYRQGLAAGGACRSCMVEIQGERVLAASCHRLAEHGMVITSDSERARRAQRLVLELLQSECAAPDPVCDSEFADLSRRLGVERTFPSRQDHVPADDSHPAIRVRLDDCIHCFRCVSACRESQVHDVIAIAGRGAGTRIVFDQADKIGQSSCVACGECVQACPTAALSPAGQAQKAVDETIVDSLCPYCGVGCLLNYHVLRGKIIHVSGRDGPANHARLCVKGRFGFDYVHHPQRLTRPLVRRSGMEKSAAPVAPRDMLKVFREADWDEALDRAANGLLQVLHQQGGQALAGFGSAKGSNEEAYLFQKLVRSGFKTNNVDHCTRLCHASSVAALLEGIGSGAVSNPVADVDQAEVILVIGAKPTVNHPVAATFMKNAVKKGTRLVLLDPHRSDLSRHACLHLQFRPDTDVPMLNAIMHCIIEEKLYNEAFIRERTEGFESLKQAIKPYSPEAVAPICGIDAETLREVARLYAGAGSAMIFWGMGISQHIHGTDNARCLIALALMTGHIGREGTGLHPLRGQNNVQGASDVGLIPMMYPGYRRVDDDVARIHFESLWQCRLDARPGLTVVEILNAAYAGQIKGMYIMGENPAMSDPNLHHARKALSRLRHLVVQEIFFTETAGYADVILPASAFAEKTGTFTNTDRRVQMGRQAVDPPGDARQDLWIIQQLAKRLGLDWAEMDVEAVFAEMRQALPVIAGMTWQRLENEHSLIYPLLNTGEDGTPTLFQERFPTPSGRALFVPVQFRHADELPDDEYPLIFTTGRQLEHWHTGSMTRRASVLDALEPEPVISIHPQDLEKSGLLAGDKVRVTSRRGQIVARARVDTGLQPGCLFMAFCYPDAAANLLTNEALDPIARIPEFKYCAVRIHGADS